MKKIKDSYKLSTGKVIHPNRGIIGLSEHEGFKIYEGYDGSWTTEENSFDVDDVELTNDELKEIAIYMSKLWSAWANVL